MRIKHYIGLVLVLVGTNLFTFAASRYWTTQHVLKRADERFEVALGTNGLYNQFYPSDGKIPHQTFEVLLAIKNAGGSYYWWNDAIGYWFWSVLLIPSGIGIMFYEPRKKPAA